jgi:hypothetical protein
MFLCQYFFSEGKKKNPPLEEGGVPAILWKGILLGCLLREDVHAGSNPLLSFNHPGRAYHELSLLGVKTTVPASISLMFELFSGAP